MDIDEVVNMLHTNLVFTSCGRSRYDWRGGHNRPRPVLSPHLEEKKNRWTSEDVETMEKASCSLPTVHHRGVEQTHLATAL